MHIINRKRRLFSIWLSHLYPFVSWSSPLFWAVIRTCISFVCTLPKSTLLTRSSRWHSSSLVAIFRISFVCVLRWAKFTLRSQRRKLLVLLSPLSVTSSPFYRWFTFSRLCSFFAGNIRSFISHAVCLIGKRRFTFSLIFNGIWLLSGLIFLKFQRCLTSIKGDQFVNFCIVTLDFGVENLQRNWLVNVLLFILRFW